MSHFIFMKVECCNENLPVMYIYGLNNVAYCILKCYINDIIIYIEIFCIYKNLLEKIMIYSTSLLFRIFRQKICIYIYSVNNIIYKVVLIYAYQILFFEHRECPFKLSNFYV